MPGVIIPLNISAIRVNANDQTSIVSLFKGRVATFEKIPFKGPSTGASTWASTGDTIMCRLEEINSPSNSLGIGVHLHWELPDYFKQGVQQSDGAVTFPQAPNRWLVVRYLSMWNSTNNSYDPVTTKSFIVESDYIGTEPYTDTYKVCRPTVSVPLIKQKSGKNENTQPYSYMGRVLDYEYENWPVKKSNGDFLPDYMGSDHKPHSLTAIGFAGPGFSSYYPECCSVFGFWDHFEDDTAVYYAITNNTTIKFKLSYQVIGWIDSSSSDPLAEIGKQVTLKYNEHVTNCTDQKVPVKETPVTVFQTLLQNQFHWKVNTGGVTYVLDAEKYIKELTVPTETLVSGVIQEIVWDMSENPAKTSFLSNPKKPESPAIWNDTVEVAVGNTTIEALSALLKFDMGRKERDSDVVLDDYEYLLNALQLGLLQNLENESSKTIFLNESLHEKAFSKSYGGWFWSLEQPECQSGSAPNSKRSSTLPLDLAEKLALLNQAQKAYDQGRAALDQMRKQLFMDWYRYVKLWCSLDTDIKFKNLLGAFIDKDGDRCELKAVVNAGNSVGILAYKKELESSKIIGVEKPAEKTSLAYEVWSRFQDVQAIVQNYDWKMQAAPAPEFFVPTDPVLLLEGNILEPARRNGCDRILAIRLSSELFSTLLLQYRGQQFSVQSSELSIPTILSDTPYKSTIQTLIGESYLLVPMLAGSVADALIKKNEAGNPATEKRADFISTLSAAQGGLNPLEGGPGTGLFACIHSPVYTPKANLTQTVNTPQAISFTFTNSAQSGWAPSPVGWNAPQELSGFAEKRIDPFQPIYLIWEATLDPLKRNFAKDDKEENYTPKNLTEYFQRHPDSVDYSYDVTKMFTTGKSVSYTGSTLLMSKPEYTLSAQIQSFIDNYPSDPCEPALKQIQKIYDGRHFMSQALSGFNTEQTLRSAVAQIQVQNLVSGVRDQITLDIKKAAVEKSNDNWYDYGFNSVAPIAAGLLAQKNFGPLRSGFLSITSLEIVDVFGQRMQLSTDQDKNNKDDNSLKTIPSLSMQPLNGDATNGKIFLPPRLLASTRLWFRWLSATHNKDMAKDFVEMNTHPDTSPVCGWLLPNHLDNSIFFYDAEGSAIGSFGLEHNAVDVKYRTRAGNQKVNPDDNLETDLVDQYGRPIVNAHVAAFMLYIKSKSADFLKDLLLAIQQSEVHIHPSRFAEDINLAVLIGRPLALVRAVLSLETSGGVLPLSQADASFGADVKNNRYDYALRQQSSSANLGVVQFPVGIGNMADIDDGLVGYLIEQPGTNPYTTFFSETASENGQHGVTKPTETSILLTLNAEPVTLTMLVDPRASVHAITGLLPVNELNIPPDHSSSAMEKLAMTFFTAPLLSRGGSLVVPVPEESGYNWEWITPGATITTPIAANAANGNAVYSYTPQEILEGWLKLAPVPKKEE